METKNFAPNYQATSSFSSVEWLNFQAVSRHKEGKFEEAVSYYLEAIDLDTNQPDWVYANLIILLGKIEHFDESAQVEKLALSIHPQSSEIYRSLGENAQKIQDMAQCLIYLQKALELDRNQPDWVYVALAENLCQKQEIASCYQLAQQGVELHPDCYSLHKIVAKSTEQNINNVVHERTSITEVNSRTSFAFNRNSLSQSELEQAEVKVTQDLPDIIENADTFFDAHNYKKALFEYEQVLKIDSNNYHGLLRTGECAFRLGNYEKAEQALTHLLQNNPQSFWGLVCLGEAYFEQAKFHLAIEHLEKALSIKEDNVWPMK